MWANVLSLPQGEEQRVRTGAIVLVLFGLCCPIPTQWSKELLPLCGHQTEVMLMVSGPRCLLIVPTSSPLLSRSTNMCLKQEGEEVKESSAMTGSQRGTGVTVGRPWFWHYNLRWGLTSTFRLPQRGGSVFTSSPVTQATTPKYTWKRSSQGTAPTQQPDIPQRLTRRGTSRRPQSGRGSQQALGMCG